MTRSQILAKAIKVFGTHNVDTIFITTDGMPFLGDKYQAAHGHAQTCADKTLYTVTREEATEEALTAALKAEGVEAPATTDEGDAGGAGPNVNYSGWDKKKLQKELDKRKVTYSKSLGNAKLVKLLQEDDKAKAEALKAAAATGEEGDGGAGEE